MARDIKVIPKTGDVAASNLPTIEFHGKDASTIVKVVDDNGDVRYEGTLGDLLSIIDGEPLGLIWAAQDVTGLSVIEAYNTGKVILGRPLQEDFKIDETDGKTVIQGEKLKVIQEATLTLNGVQIGNLNSSPQEIVAAPSAGKAIQVVSASYKSVFDTAAFATNTNMRLIGSGLTREQMGTDIAHTASLVQLFSVVNTLADQVNVADGVALDVDVSSGNPTGGAAGSSITITVQYVIIDV